jgi:hypothetical protein
MRGGAPMIRQLLSGIAVVAVTIVVATVCLIMGVQSDLRIFIIVLCGLGMFAAAMGAGVTTQAITAGLIGAVISAGCGLLTLDQSAPLFGSSVSGIGVADAPLHDAAFYRFTDGRVLADRGEAVMLMATSSLRQDARPIYPYTIAPLVGGNWSPGQAIPAWVITARDQGPRGAQWSSPLRAAVRVTTADPDEIQTAIHAIERHARLISAPNAPLLRWVADPHGAQLAEWRRLAIISLGGSMLWLLALLGVRAVFWIRARFNRSRRSLGPRPPQPGMRSRRHD